MAVLAVWLTTASPMSLVLVPNESALPVQSRLPPSREREAEVLGGAQQRVAIALPGVQVVRLVVGSAAVLRPLKSTGAPFQKAWLELHHQTKPPIIYRRRNSPIDSLALYMQLDTRAI
jgi:hypothetical protein